MCSVVHASCRFVVNCIQMQLAAWRARQSGRRCTQDRNPASARSQNAATLAPKALHSQCSCPHPDDVGVLIRDVHSGGNAPDRLDGDPRQTAELVGRRAKLAKLGEHLAGEGHLCHVEAGVTCKRGKGVACKVCCTASLARRRPQGRA